MARGKKAQSLDELPLALLADLPDWVVERLGKRCRTRDPRVRRALQQPAPLDLRVNTLRTKRDAVLEKLRGDGIKCEPAPYSPLGVRVHGRLRSIGIASSRRQHRGAGRRQPVLGFLLAPRRHDLVVDFCAGAGGKALMLGA